MVVVLRSKPTTGGLGHMVAARELPDHVRRARCTAGGLPAPVRPPRGLPYFGPLPWVLSTTVCVLFLSIYSCKQRDYFYYFVSKKYHLRRKKKLYERVEWERNITRLFIMVFPISYPESSLLYLCASLCVTSWARTTNKRVPINHTGPLFHNKNRAPDSTTTAGASS